MIFQEPMTSLNPSFTAGSQIAEALHQGSDHRVLAHRANRAGDLIREQRALSVAPPRVRDRHCRHELAGVSVLRVFENRAAWADLDDLTQVHHRNPVADALHHCHVVRNEDEGHTLISARSRSIQIVTPDLT